MTQQAERRKKKGVVGVFSDIKDLVTSIGGIITVIVSVLASLGVGVAVGHQTATQAAPVTITVTKPGDAPPATTTTTTSGGPTSSTGGSTTLSATKPVQTTGGIYNMASVASTIGTTSYANSVRFQCQFSGSLVYDVSGYKFLDTTVGVPNDAANGAGNTVVVTFFKDSNANEQLTQPMNIVVGAPQTVHLDLQGAAQLQIQCAPTSIATHAGSMIDLVLGNGTLTR